jgi:formate-dependent nitrite reductase cytochrome c552 subunit
MRSLDREFEDLAHPVVKSKKSTEQEAKESLSELKRLEERVQLLTLATSFGEELRVPENGKDDITRRLGMEVKEVNEAKSILSKLVGKKGIRKGYEEVKKDLSGKRMSRQQSELEVSHERDEDSEDDAFNY